MWLSFYSTLLDKPFQITVALAQKSDKDGMFAFGGENVTRGNLKNLIVDEPSPSLPTPLLIQTAPLPPESSRDSMMENRSYQTPMKGIWWYSTGGGTEFLMILIMQWPP